MWKSRFFWLDYWLSSCRSLPALQPASSFGWLALFAGVAHLVYAWWERGAGAILWKILIGLVYVIAGLYMLVLPVAGVIALTLVLAVYIAAE